MAIGHDSPKLNSAPSSGHFLVGRRESGGGLPVRRRFTTLFSKSNQNGAPIATAMLLMRIPRIFQGHSQPSGMPRTPSRAHPMGGTSAARIESVVHLSTSLQAPLA